MLPNRIPFRLPSAGVSLTRPATGVSYTIDNIGLASPIDLRNEVDALGEMIRTSRQSGESDYSYLGRLQRLWISARLPYRSGTEGRMVRTISSYLGRVTISGLWDGHTLSTLPSGTSFLDPLSITGQTDSLSVSAGTIVPFDPGSTPYCTSLTAGSLNTPLASSLVEYSTTLGLSEFPSAFQSPYDLSASRHSLSVNNQLLTIGKDYIISGESPTVFLVKSPVTIGDVILRVTTPNPVRFLLSNDPLVSWGSSRPSLNRESLPSSYKSLCFGGESGLFHGGTQIASTSGSIGFPAASLTPLVDKTISSVPVPNIPLFFGQGVQVSGLDRIEKRLLRQPGESLLTVLGAKFLGPAQAYLSWNSLPTLPSPLGIPLDL
jgi:hypothetical protein